MTSFNKLMRIFFFFLFVLCWNNSWAIDIEIYTENWPPLNFENGGKITGFTTDIVREIQRRTKIKGEIELLPWKRAYFYALNKKNALIYSIVRNPQREGLFRWVGPIYPRRVSLFKLKSRRDIIVKNVKDIKKYKIGVVRGYASTQDLINLGIPENNFDYVISEDLNTKKLLAERFSLMVGVELAVQARFERLGFDPKNIVPVYIVDETYQQYLGFNKKTSDHIVFSFQKALKSLKDDGTYKKFKFKYKLK